MNKVTAIRIDEEILEKIKTYSEIKKVSQTDLINELLTDALNQLILQRSGAAMFTIPNPQHFSVDQAKTDEVLDILANAAKSIHDSYANIPIPIYGILAFLEQRLKFDLPEEIEAFKQNMILDGTLSENLAENKNSVGRR